MFQSDNINLLFIFYAINYHLRKKNMNTEKLNQFVFSQMVMQKAKALAATEHGKAVNPSDEHILKAVKELYAEQDAVKRVTESSATEPKVRFL